jgi:hypothetical protein
LSRQRRWRPFEQLAATLGYRVGTNLSGRVLTNLDSGTQVNAKTRDRACREGRSSTIAAAARLIVDP